MLDELKQCAIDAALLGGKILKEGFGTDLNTITNRKKQSLN